MDDFNTYHFLLVKVCVLYTRQLGCLNTDNNFYITNSKWFVACRTELEDAIQNKHGLGISVVVLVVGGDLKILRRCVKALERNIPIVVMKGTGMAADLVADVIDLPPETEVQRLLERINEYFEEIDEQTLKVRIMVDWDGILIS